MSAPPPPSAPTSANAEAVSAVSGALLSVTLPSIRALSSTLVELQESQQVLVSTVAAKRSELLDSSSDWRDARAALERLPEYSARVASIMKTQAATAALLARTEQSSIALRTKLEERDKERAAKKSADAAGFAAVASK